MTYSKDVRLRLPFWQVPQTLDLAFEVHIICDGRSFEQFFEFSRREPSQRTGVAATT